MRQCPKCGERYGDELSFCPNDGTATTVIAQSERPGADAIGSVIDGRYRIEGRIGEGGMGVVYRASHVVLKKQLAIKVMRGEQAQDGEIVQRFVQEAQASSAIGHPNIIGISDFGKAPDGSVYFAMEYLEGQTLGKAMEKGPLARARAIGIFVQIADALEAAHQRGIIHRDLKPDNIFLIRSEGRDDFVKVLDFGIAKVKNAAAKITRTGMVFGTPHYMSPEQAAGQAVDHRSDIYSLGVIMYQVFTGQLPFDAESYMGVITKHMYDPPVPPSSLMPELRGAIEDIIMMALAKTPEERYGSMLELREDLSRALAGDTTKASERAALRGGDTLAVSAAPHSAREPSGRASLQRGDSTAHERDTEAVTSVHLRKRPVWLVAVVAAVAGFAALVLLRPPGGDRSGDQGGDVGMVVPAPAPTRAPSAAPQPAAAPSAASPAPAPPEALPIRLVAVPAEAEIFVDGALIGQGSATVQRPKAGSSVRASVRARGYLDKQVLLDAQSAEELRVALDADTLPETPRAAPRKRTTAVTAPPSERQAPAAARRGAPLTEVVDPWQ